MFNGSIGPGIKALPGLCPRCVGTCTLHAQYSPGANVKYLIVMECLRHYSSRCNNALKGHVKFWADGFPATRREESGITTHTEKPRFRPSTKKAVVFQNARQPEGW